MKKLLVILITINVCSVLLADDVTEEWVAKINDTRGHEMKVGADGNVYVTGTVFIEINDKDMITAKYLPNGVRLWLRTYDPGIYRAEGKAITTDSVGNVYVTGYSEQLINHDFTITTLKYDALGILKWIRKYSVPSHYSGESIAVDDTGNVYITADDGSKPGADIITIKYNASGTQMWVKTYHTVEGSNSARLILDGNANVYVMCGSHVISEYDSDFILIKYNSSGSLQWVSRYNTPENGEEIPAALVMDKYGNIIITGYTWNAGLRQGDILTVKFNFSGVLQWVNRFSNPDHNDGNGRGVTVDNLGNIYVTGDIDFPLVWKMVTIKYSPSGILRWSKTSTAISSSGKSIATDPAGNVYVVGEAKVQPPFIGGVANYETRTIKYNYLGEEQWIKHYNGAGARDDRAISSIALDTNGNVFVAGNSTNGTSVDYVFTIKYAPAGNDIISMPEVPVKFSLSQNYPNPFNPVTNIEFSLAHSGFVKLIVFDITGRMVSTLVNENMEPGTHKVNFDAGKLSSGTYFYKITAGNFADIKKMIFVK